MLDPGPRCGASTDRTITAGAVEGAIERCWRLLRVIAAAAVAIPRLLAAGGTAVAGTGQPSPWQLGLQRSASPVMDNLVSFHNFLLVLITLITVFVLALLVVVIVKFNARANPTPTRTTHNTLLEVLWTVVPVVILVVIAIPSFRLLFFQLNMPAGRHHRQGDRQAVVLDLQLSGPRPVRVRTR